jgi:hypothetical protein
VQPAGVSNLKNDEEVRLLPAVAVRDGDGWRVDLRVWVFEPEADSWRRGAAVEALATALELPPGSAASEVFRERARTFLVDNESGKRVVVRIGGKDHPLALTGANGHSVTELRLADADLPAPLDAVTAVRRPATPAASSAPSSASTPPASRSSATSTTPSSSATCATSSACSSAPF